MSTAPSNRYKWAIDSVFDTAVGPSGSAWHNEPNKILPIDARVSQGYVPSQSLDAESLNYLLNSHGEWIGWASGAINQNELTGSDLLSRTVLLEGTASNLKARVNVIETVLTGTNLSGSSGELGFLGGSRSKTKFFSPFELGTASAQIATGTNSWYMQLSKVLTSVAIFPKATLDLTRLLPSGSVMTRVWVSVQPGQARASGSRMILSYNECTGSTTTPGFPVTPNYVTYDLDFDDGTVNNQFLDSGTVSITINNGTKYQWLSVTGGDTADTLRDDIMFLAISYNDPGPRNF